MGLDNVINQQHIVSGLNMLQDFFTNFTGPNYALIFNIGEHLLCLKATTDRCWGVMPSPYALLGST